MPLLYSLQLIKVALDVGGCFWSSYHSVKLDELDWLITMEDGVRKEAFVSCQMGLPRMAALGVDG